MIEWMQDPYVKLRKLWVCAHAANAYAASRSLYQCVALSLRVNTKRLTGSDIPINELIGSKFPNFNDDDYGLVNPDCCGPKPRVCLSLTPEIVSIAWVRHNIARTRRVHS